MAMAWMWIIMVGIAVIFGIINGIISAIANAAMDGAQAAVTLSITLLGVICLWSGIMELIRRGGISRGLAKILRPILIRLFPENKNNPDAMEAISANVSANLLGLGNAATPLGIKAALAMKRGDTATKDMCMLVVLNTASIQLIPATVAGVRAASGAVSPFDILPAVWITSICSVVAGITVAKILSRTHDKKEKRLQPMTRGRDLC